MEGPSGCLGASHACRVTHPCTFWGWSEKGTQSLCSAALLFLPLLPPRTQWVPMAIACLVAASRCDSPAASPQARWQPGARAPRYFDRDGLPEFHQKETLSFTQARKLPVLLPGIMEGLQDANANTKTKALLLFRNVTGHVKRKKASSIALQVAGEILPLFHDVRLLRDLSPQMGTLMTAALQPSPGGRQHLGRGVSSVGDIRPLCKAPAAKSCLQTRERSLCCHCHVAPDDLPTCCVRKAEDEQVLRVLEAL